VGPVLGASGAGPVLEKSPWIEHHGGFDQHAEEIRARQQCTFLSHVHLQEREAAACCRRRAIDSRDERSWLWRTAEQPTVLLVPVVDRNGRDSRDQMTEPGRAAPDRGPQGASRSAGRRRRRLAGSGSQPRVPGPHGSPRSAGPRSSWASSRQRLMQWALQDLNLRPPPCNGGALSI
jgi:hypothetical protein